MSRRRLFIVAAGAAVLLGGGLIAALVLTTRGSTGSTSTGPAGVAEVAAMLRNVPQHGAALGSPAAPVTLVEFADPQCPYCGDWERISLPTIVDKYVRAGKVRIVFNGMSFVGPDSETALRTALAAGEQNRLWNVIALLYLNQGTENTGWVTDSLLRGIGDAIPGLDTKKMLASLTSATVTRRLAAAAALAKEAGVNQTPSFAVGRTNKALKLVQVTSLEPAGIEPELDAALRE
jgi:protein-disulfide isomerase